MPVLGVGREPETQGQSTAFQNRVWLREQAICALDQSGVFMMNSTELLTALGFPA